MASELTLEILDQAINKIKEFRNTQTETIRINPNTWKRAVVTMKTLCGVSYSPVNIPSDACFGIPVITDDAIPEDEMLLYLDKDHFVRVKHIGRN